MTMTKFNLIFFKLIMVISELTSFSLLWFCGFYYKARVLFRKLKNIISMKWYELKLILKQTELLKEM